MRCLFPILLVLLAMLSVSAKAEGVGLGAISISFDDPAGGQIMPRRSHQTLDVTTLNIKTLDAAILHAPEPDTLAALNNPPDTVPKEAEIVWHGPIRTTGANDGPALPDAQTHTAIDVLKLVPNLQPGFYYLVVKSGDQAKAVRPFLISNLGLEALTGADGIAAVVRLLSEARPAQNVEVALISGNNRELARVRTGADGVARFTPAAIGGKGQDAPAALYAYGADGEFSALSLGYGDILHAQGTDSPPAFPRAWLAIDKRDPQPEDVVHGITIMRQADGKDVQGSAIVDLLANDGRVLEQHPLDRDHGGIAPFTLHLPAGPDKGWTIAVRDADDEPLGSLDPAKAAPAAPPKPAHGAPFIQLGAGRRTFQAGETANISVQTPEAAEVTLAVIDASVHAIVTQHIDKAGGVIQIPLPADASGGVWIYASSTSPASDNGADRPVHRGFGLQWLDIDQGARRFGVRLDLPDSAEAGGGVPVHVTLPDNQSAKTDFAVIGTAADQPSGIDPLGQLYGRRASAVKIFDGYSIVQPPSDGSMQAPPNLQALMHGEDAMAAPVLLWTSVLDAPGGNADPVVALPDTVRPGRLRLSVVAASSNAMGFAESAIDIKPAKGGAHKANLAPAPKAVAGTLKPGAILTMPPDQLALVSASPIIAAPLWVDPEGRPHYLFASDPDALEMMRSLGDKAPTQSMILDLMLAEALDAPDFARDQARLRVIEALRSPDMTLDDRMLALHALYHAGDVPLWAQPLLTAPLPGTASWLARLCRFGLTGSDVDLKAIPEAETSDNLEEQLLTVLVTRMVDAKDRRVVLPEDLLEDMARHAFRPGLDWRSRLALKAAQDGLDHAPALRPEWDAIPSLSGGDGKYLAVIAGDPPARQGIRSLDKRSLSTLMLFHWPDGAPD